VGYSEECFVVSLHEVKVSISNRRGGGSFLEGWVEGCWQRALNLEIGDGLAETLLSNTVPCQNQINFSCESLGDAKHGSDTRELKEVAGSGSTFSIWEVYFWLG
jgi:hypothetical protein